MIIKGKYRDTLTREGKIIQDHPWKSNTIVPDYGRFLAALMKKDFKIPVGIEYIAVGSGSTDESEFKTRVIDLFKPNPDPGSIDVNWGPGNQWWAWAKPIEVGGIKYLNASGDVVTEPNHFTNRLRIEVTFEQNEPPAEVLELKEFALLGIEGTDSSGYDLDRLFLVNHVTHGPWKKYKDMELKRTIELMFPIEK